MRELLIYIVFGWYPYFCLTVFLLGSLAALRPRAVHLAQRVEPVAAPPRN